ncbi:MAG: type II toxin-antitoxin system VapC family toxin [Lautropia sp.]
MTAELVFAEPPSTYDRRPLLVVDASVLAAVLFQEATASAAQALIHGRALHAPALLDFELANVASSKARRGLTDRDAAGAALDALSMLDLIRHPAPPASLLRLAARYGLSAYDAAYLWLAEALPAPLATFDARLGEAARRHLAGARSPDA